MKQSFQDRYNCREYVNLLMTRKDFQSRIRLLDTSASRSPGQKVPGHGHEENGGPDTSPKSRRTSHESPPTDELQRSRSHVKDHVRCERKHQEEYECEENDFQM